jgi:hypothetical protein
MFENKAVSHIREESLGGKVRQGHFPRAGIFPAGVKIWRIGPAPPNNKVSRFFDMASAPLHVAHTASHRRLVLSMGLALIWISVADGFLVSPLQTLLNRNPGCKLASNGRRACNSLTVQLL